MWYFEKKGRTREVGRACAVFFFLFCVGCSGSGTKEKQSEGSTGGGLSPELTSTQDAPASSENDTTVEWSGTSYDFGTVQEGDVVEKVFAFTNTGQKPMLISNASSTCGCTVPEWPKDEILPRQKREIRVRFDTKGKRGTQNKKVWVTANTNPAISTLVLQGEVVAKESSDAAE